MKKISILLTFIFMSVAIATQAQERKAHPVQNSTNFGLTAPQDPSTLPTSYVPVVWPEQLPKETAVTVLRPVAANKWTITGGWELAQADKIIEAGGSLFDRNYNTSEWYNATVPGTVLTTLVDRGVYPDPYFGVNNLYIPEELCRTDWWYRTDFNLPEAAAGKRVWLHFDGINYRADVWMNGKKLGDIRGAFVRAAFDVTEIVKNENVLAIHIYPPNNPGIPHEQSSTALRGPNGGQLALDGATFISSEGWDWIPGIRDRNIGIWQDVHIAYTDDVTIGDIQVITDLPLPDVSSADLTIRTSLENHSSVNHDITINGKIENIAFSHTVMVPGNTKVEVNLDPSTHPQLKVRNPRLWWPNGYGSPELYTLDIDALNHDGTISDTKQTRFGIRELSYELTVDAKGKDEWRVEYNPNALRHTGKPIFDHIHRRKIGDGVEIPYVFDYVDLSLLDEIPNDGTEPYIVFKVNGVRIFCKGGNWGMDDGMKRVSREKMEPYFVLHRDANYNMIRNWTGEMTEEVFYDLCDEYGMLVWNDFWMSTEGYNLNPNDEDMFMDNARDVVRRFVNHPSLALWGPRNEGYAPHDLERRLSQMIAEEDGTRHWHGNSRYLNLRPSGPWYYMTDQADYYRYNAHGFNTEQGTPSVPTANTIRKFMAEPDQWPISEVWYYHDLHFGQVDYLAAIDSLYGTPTSLDDFCRKAQLVNYDSHRAMFESWNSKLWNSTSGLLLWMTHPAWPSVVWQTYSWDYETHGSYFGSMKGCEPLHIQMNLHDDKVIVTNMSLNSYVKSKASLNCYDLNGKQLLKKEVTLPIIRENALTDCFTAELGGIEGIYIARVVLTDNRGRVLSTNDYLKGGNGVTNFHSINELEEVTLNARIVSQSGTSDKTLTVEISNPTKVPALSIKLNLRDQATGEVILPAYFSDGYFNLLPSEKRTVTVDYSWDGKVTVSTDGYNVTDRIVATGK